MKLLRDFLLALVLVAVSTGGGAFAASALPGHACPRAGAAPGAATFAPRTERPVLFKAAARMGIHGSGVAGADVVQHTCHATGTLTLGAAPVPMRLVVPKGDGSLRPSVGCCLVAGRIDTLYRPPKA